MPHTWITKVNNVDTVDAAHVNDLQTYKLDSDIISRPEDYGAFGDGIADDGAALLSAFAAGTNKKIFLRGVTYYYSANLVLTGKELIGVPGQTVLKPAGGVTVGLTMNSGATVSGVYLDGTNTNGATGILVGSTTLDNWMVLRDVQVWSFKGAGAKGVHIHNAVGISMDNCYICKNETNFYFDCGLIGPGLPTTANISRTAIREAVTKGIKFVSSYGISFTDCVIEDNGEEGIYSAPLIGTNVDHTHFTRCWFEDNNSGDPAHYQVDMDGTALGYIEHLTFQNCFFSTGTKAIHLTTVFYLHISGGWYPDTPGVVQIDGVNSSGWIDDFRRYTRVVNNGIVTIVDNKLDFIDQDIKTTASPTYETITLTDLDNGLVPYQNLTDDIIPVKTGGTELVINGGFDVNVNNWTPTNCTLASIGGGQYLNCLELTATGGSTQHAVSSAVIILAIGETYRLTFYTHSGSTGNEAGQVWVTDSLWEESYNSTFSCVGSWVQHSVTFTPVSHTNFLVFIYKNTATLGTMLFDSVSLKKVPGFIDSPIFADGTNVGVSQQSFGINADKVIAVGTGTAPTTSPADCFQLWSEDSGGVAGKASPHFRCEDGTVLDLLTISGAPAAHNVLSASHTDSSTASPLLGDIIHGNATPKWARLAGNTTTAKQYLSQTGTGAVSAVPAWAAIIQADVTGLTTSDRPTFAGATLVMNGAALAVKRSSAGTGNIYFDIQDNVGGEMAYFGFGAGTNDFYISNLLDGNMIFYNDSGTALYIQKNTGNIGIGISAPTAPLTVQASAATALGIDLLGRGDNYGFIQFFKNDGVTLEGAIYGITGRLTLTDLNSVDMISIIAGKVGIHDIAPAEVLDVTGNINATGAYKVVDTQVVGPRVIDARCDDSINAAAWDATTAGVLTSLRDAMVTHGLIAAA